jgi:hypothetical protein
MMSNAKMHMTNFFFNILNISMHPYLKLNYDFLGLKSLSDNLGFLRGSQTLTTSSGHQQDIRRRNIRDGQMLAFGVRFGVEFYVF